MPRFSFDVVITFQHWASCPTSTNKKVTSGTVMTFSIWIMFAIVIIPVVFTSHGNGVVAISTSSNSSQIRSISNLSEFSAALSESPHSFVKLFHPKCPHCVAMAGHFVTLSQRLAEYNGKESTSANRTVACLQVDISIESNGPLADQYIMDGVPTLLLFHSNKSSEEFGGARTATAMYKFVTTSIALSETSELAHFTTAKQVSNFLNLVAHRPVVISVLHDRFPAQKHFPEYMPMPIAEWKAITTSSPPVPKPVFATVSNPSLLIHQLCKSRYDDQSAPYAVMPIAIAAPSADNLCKEARWYFPGVKDSESISSFIHSSIVQYSDFVTLTKENSRHILNSDRPLGLVFGDFQRPSFYALPKLRAVARIPSEPEVLAVYLHLESFPDFAEHVNVSLKAYRKQGDGAIPMDEIISLVLYRYVHGGPVIQHYQRNISMSRWISEQAQVINDTRVTTRAGETTVLTRKTWDALFKYENRPVLLLLTDGVASSYEKWMQSIAQTLQSAAGTLVVASFDEQSLGRPEWPDTSEVTKLPALMVITPSIGVSVFDGVWTTRSVARFARDEGDIHTPFDHGIVWSDVAVSFAFFLAVVLLIGGICLVRRRYRWERLPETAKDLEIMIKSR